MTSKTVIEVPADVFERLTQALDSMAPPRHAHVRLLSVRETAAYLSRSQDWVRRRLTRKIPAVMDGDLRFDIRDLDAYIENAKLRQSLE